MIKELGIVREPRGISWQNWAATCKDTLINNAKYLVVALLVVGAVIGGTLYVKQAGTNNLAHRDGKPTTTNEKVNLNTQPSTLPTAAAGSTQTTSTTSSGTHTITNKSTTGALTPTKPVTPVCNIAAQTAAKLQYSTNLALENTYHTTQLTLLGVTGAVGSLLGNPNSAQINAENSRHQAALGSLQTQLTNQLTTAHCPTS